MASIAWDAYEELGVSCSASLDEIKTAFREKARKFHPDKMSSIGEAETFIKIRRAYEILSDEASRSSYDRSLMCSVNSTSNILEVDLDDMEYDEASETFSQSCRCSGKYTISVSQMEKGFDTVSCSSCSLCIRILYEIEES